ncbi:MAG: hypothetical protein ACR2GT_05185 [Gaiellaceae bacterium]
MLDLHRISTRLALLAGLSLLAMLIVPAASAVEPMIEGGNGSSTGGGATADPGATFEVSAGGFDWSIAAVPVLVGLIVLVTVVAAHRVASRRGGQLAAR